MFEEALRNSCGKKRSKRQGRDGKTYSTECRVPEKNNERLEDFTHGLHQMVNTEIKLIIFRAVKDGEALHSRQKQDRELTVAQIMSSLLPNSGFNEKSRENH